jgi:Transposase IS66 family
LRAATEGALRGAVNAHGFLCDAVMVSDDAGQFNVGQHALCWIHAERLVHKLETFTGPRRSAQQHRRGLRRLTALLGISPLHGLRRWFYVGLKAYRLDPARSRRSEVRTRFDRIFRRRTGFATPDRLLQRLHANKAELLRVLDHPDIPPHINGSENDIRCQVTKRSAAGRRATSAVIAAMPFSGSARPAKSPASPSGRSC